jgi:class 3 adenylate cyclase
MMKDIYAELDRLGLTEQVAEPDDMVPVVAAEATPLDFLQAVYRNPALPLSVRIRAGVAAAQYVHPRISVVAAAGDPRNIADRLELLIRQHRKPKLIEARPQPDQQHIRRRI